MEMSHEYLRETTEKMREHGFAVAEDCTTVERKDGLPYERSRYEVTRGDSEDLVLEYLVYPDGTESYWLEVRKIGSIRTFPFRLDSWKWRDDQVEFSFYGHEDGSALSFVLSL